MENYDISAEEDKFYKKIKKFKISIDIYKKILYT